MKRCSPRHFTILISRTGKKPIVLSCSHRMARLSAALIISLPMGLITLAAYAYTYRTTQIADKNSALIHQNLQLTQSNSELLQSNSTLTERAQNILQRLETLETKIQELRKRAGIPQDPSKQNQSKQNQSKPFNSNAPKLQNQAFRGEPRSGVRAEMLLNVAKVELPNLVKEVGKEVEPALTQKLMREASRPKGLPLWAKAEVSSTYGWRSDPFLETYTFHQGSDFTAPYGSAVHATAPGIVETAEWDAGFGNHIVINHGFGYSSLYAHLSGINVVQGEKVKPSQVIGYLGNTGRSSGPHLHYGIYYANQAVDPKDYLH